MRAIFNQIVHTRLCNTSALGRFCLSDAELVDYLANVDDQVPAKQQVLRFCFRKPQVAEDVVASMVAFKGPSSFRVELDVK